MNIQFEAPVDITKEKSLAIIVSSDDGVVDKFNVISDSTSPDALIHLLKNTIKLVETVAEYEHGEKK